VARARVTSPRILPRRYLASFATGWVVAAIAPLLASCGRQPPPPAAPPTPAYRRLQSPYGFVDTDPHGNWASVATDQGGRPTHIVAGLAPEPEDGGYRGCPRLPRSLFADPLEVPLDPWATVSVPPRSDARLLIVTTQGYEEAQLPRPLADVAAVLWNLEGDGGSVREVVTAAE